MFENTTNFDFEDDDLLNTSFTPVISSTQPSQVGKRQNQESAKENQKKPKLLDFSINSPKNTSLKCSTRTLSDKIIETTFKSPNTVVKRKFPGPAGLLPERTESNKSILELMADEKSEKEDDISDHMFLCSQQTVSAFEDGPWKQMSKDFCSSSGERLYEKFTIGWIKKQASLKKLLVNHKAPFLAAIIQSLDIYDGKVPTVNVTLKDATGDIQGTILHSLYEDYSSFFTTGSVLVLKQFGVLSAGYNNHCLTITPNNLLTIYCLEVPKKLPNEEVNTSQSNQGSVKKIEIQRCLVDDIIRKYDEDVLENKVRGEKRINFDRLNVENSAVRNSSSENLLGSKKLMPEAGNYGRTNFYVSHGLQQPSGAVLKEPNCSNMSLNRGFNNSKVNSNIVNKQFNFKKSADIQVTDRTGDKVGCSQISVTAGSKEHTEIWKNLLEGVDTNSLFDDF